jgi:hypothetical protein
VAEPDFVGRILFEGDLAVTRKTSIALVCLCAIVQVGCGNRPGEDRTDRTELESSRQDAIGEGTLDNESVRACFEGYKQAILDQDGNAAVALVDGNTLEYYGEMRRLALEGKPEIVRNLSTIDKMMVLMLRHQTPVEDLSQMSGDSLFVYAVDKGWIGRESVISNELGDITVSGDHASGVHVSAGTETPLRWMFQKKDGNWKLDITSIMPAADQAFKQMIRESGQSEDEFLVAILESVSGRRVPESIWEPMAVDPQIKDQ